MACSVETASFAIRHYQSAQRSFRTPRGCVLTRQPHVCVGNYITLPTTLSRGSGSLGGKGALRALVPSRAVPNGRCKYRMVPRCSLQGSASDGPSMALLLEIDGVVADLHDCLHRASFNEAFEELGLGCYRWNEAMYKDLLRAGQGSPEGMCLAYFKTVGFPMLLRTEDEPSFIGQVVKQKDIAARALVKEGKIPLKYGVQQFLEDAHAKGIPVLLVHPADMPLGEDITRALLAKLHPKLKEGPHPVRAGVHYAIRDKPSAAAALSAAAGAAIKAAKVTAATSAASVLDDVVVDLAHLDRSANWVPILQAAVESLELPAGRCCLVAGGNAGVQAAMSLGMSAVVVKNSMTGAGEFPGSLATFDGLGVGGGATLQKIEPLLKQVHESKKPAGQ
eukprot:jgi/Mesvir1/15040/Mv14693-RA.1